jgi:hypothetical protein
MVVSELVLRTINKYLKDLEKRFQSLVTVTVTGQKLNIYCIKTNMIKKLENRLSKNIDYSNSFENVTFLLPVLLV